VVVSFAVVVGVIAVRDYLKSSLDTNSPLAVAFAAPTILLSGNALDTNPVADSSYWSKTDVRGNIDALAYPNRWPIEDVLKTIQAKAKTLSVDRLSIGLFSNYEWFNGHAFEYWLRRLGMSTQFQMSLPLPPPTNESPAQFLSRFDVLILKTGQILAHMGYPFAQDVHTYFDRVAQDDYRLLRDADWRLVKRWPLPDGSEATVWNSKDIETFQLTKLFNSAVPSHLTPGYIMPWQGDVGGEQRTGIFMHPRPDTPASALTWKISVPPDASELAFGIAFVKGVCAEAVAPVRYRVDISEGGRAETVFDHVLELMPCDKSRWSDFVVSLRPWQGKSVDLSISTRPAAGNNVNSAHAVWSGLEIR
jgi:hypothetical protein